jgi:hypothetical protein
VSLALLPEGLARADGMSGVIIFAVVYAIVTIMGKMKQASQKGAEGTSPKPKPGPQQPRSPQPRLQPQRPPRPPQPAASRPSGNTQAEGTRLEELIRVLTEAAGVPTAEGPMGRPARVPLPPAEEVEERESLEVGERIQNLETDARRPTRREVDHDDEAEAIVQRRILAAQERDRSLSREDHRVFDRKIRAAVADNTRVANPKLVSLRQAIIWREILGPPISLRDRTDSDL